MTLHKELDSILNSYKRKAKKSLGQNFLINEGVLDRIAGSIKADAESRIIEVGSGTGFLTDKLYSRFTSGIACIELDDDWAGYLKKKFSGTNVCILHRDILDVSFDDLRKALNLREDERVWLCGNIPYSISSPLIEKIIRWKSRLSGVTLLVQKEFGERMAADPGSRNSNILACWLQLFADVKILLTVSKGNFRPVPKVDSVVVELVWKDRVRLTGDQRGTYLQIVKKAFSQRRKMISNTLADLYGGKDAMLEKLEQSGVRPDLRPESLSLEQWIQLAANGLK